MGFTKLDEGLIFSSLMREDDSVFRVWIILLATCKSDGISKLSSDFLSLITKKPPDEIERCLTILESPDPTSRSKNDDGRRIERVDGGFFIINYHKYRERDVSDYERDRKRKQRVNFNCPGQSRNVHGPSASASASGITEDPKKDTPAKPKRRRYGEYKHVLLTDEQVLRFKNKHGERLFSESVKVLDEAIQEKGYKYKDHNLTIQKWPLEKAKNSVVEPDNSNRPERRIV